VLNNCDNTQQGGLEKKKQELLILSLLFSALKLRFEVHKQGPKLTFMATYVTLSGCYWVPLRNAEFWLTCASVRIMDCSIVRRLWFHYGTVKERQTHYNTEKPSCCGGGYSM